jgi:hypothetical protein
MCKGKPFFQNTQELSKEKRLQTVHKQFTNLPNGSQTVHILSE